MLTFTSSRSTSTQHKDQICSLMLLLPPKSQVGMSQDMYLYQLRRCLEKGELSLGISISRRNKPLTLEFLFVTKAQKQRTTKLLQRFYLHTKVLESGRSIFRRDGQQLPPSTLYAVSQYLHMTVGMVLITSFQGPRLGNKGRSEHLLTVRYLIRNVFLIQNTSGVHSA